MVTLANVVFILKLRRKKRKINMEIKGKFIVVSGLWNIQNVGM
jgi:hypothetical protein